MLVRMTIVESRVIPLFGSRGPLGRVPVLTSSSLGSARGVMWRFGGRNGNDLLLNEGIELGHLLQNAGRRRMGRWINHDDYGLDQIGDVEVGIRSRRERKRRRGR